MGLAEGVKEGVVKNLLNELPTNYITTESNSHKEYQLRVNPVPANILHSLAFWQKITYCPSL